MSLQKKILLPTLGLVSLFLPACVVIEAEPYAYYGRPAVYRPGGYAALPSGHGDGSYWYGGRYYRGGRYEAGRYFSNGRYYDHRYLHEGRYYYGGQYHQGGNRGHQRGDYGHHVRY